MPGVLALAQVSDGESKSYETLAKRESWDSPIQPLSVPHAVWSTCQQGTVYTPDIYDK